MASKSVRLDFLGHAVENAMTAIAKLVFAIFGAFLGGIVPGMFISLGTFWLLAAITSDPIPAITGISMGVLLGIAGAFFGMFLGKAIFEAGIANTERVANIQFNRREKRVCIMLGVVTGLVGFVWMLQRIGDL